ncbi:MAG: 30S ribosomal protein S2 [Anaerolineae bacterium]|nr:MAG: 30S ribosomal protein S2 [Anaerolineae bacterium]
MAKISMKALLESGVHFGHRTHRWNPYMKPYIFTERNGIHIIDLQQTVGSLEGAYNQVRDAVSKGGTVLFVGTKRQATETIEMEAQRCGMPYVTVRWLGGMLTNWTTMRARVLELEKLERAKEKGDFERLTKKEGLLLTRKIERLESRFGGIRKLHRLPDMLFIVDVRREETAVKEANTLNIPIVALVDTNCDPRDIDFVIPSNDDAIRAIKLMVGYIADAALEGRSMRKDEEEDTLMPASAPEPTVIEDEMSDADLLGAATLAKMEAAAESELVDELEESADADVTMVAPDAAIEAEDEEDVIEEEDDDSETVTEDEAK